MLVRARPEIDRWRSSLRPEDIVEVGGIPCTSLTGTGFDLARTLPLRRAVVALDVLGRQAGLARVAVLTYRDGHRGWKGLHRVEQAVLLADPRARSTGETRLRLVGVARGRRGPRRGTRPVVGQPQEDRSAAADRAPPGLRP